MFLKKIAHNKPTLITLILFTLAFFLTRLPSLGIDEINPDAVNWHYRSEQFVVGLKTEQLEKTYQHYHPGITLMWIMGVPVELVKQVVPGHEIYNHENFLLFHTVSKVTLVVVHFILSLLAIYLLNLVLRLRKTSKPFLFAIVFVSLLSLEPFFLGNSRILHLDMLLTLLLFCGLLATYISGETMNRVYFALSGFLLAASFLTKSIAIGAVLYATLYLSFVIYTRRGSYKNLVIFLLTLFAGVFIMFPALWVAPIAVVTDIFSEASRIGLRDGHSQIFFGQTSENPGSLFYFVVLLLKLSPVVLIGVLLGVRSLVQGHKIKDLITPNLGTFLLVFYIGYVVVMTYSSKKLDRYMLPVFPPIVLLATYGYFTYLRKSIWALTLIVLLVTAPLISYFPYYFLYTNPFFKDPVNANKIVGQKPFGIGVPSLKEHILSNYGDYPTLGFIDTKPMRTIYMNSRVFDIRESGTKNYDLLILGVNEVLPEKVAAGSTEFRLDTIVYIEGLEYWRIYVKED